MVLIRLQKCKTDTENFEINSLTEKLKEIGDNVVAVKTGSVVKIYIHTFAYDKVFAL